MRRHPVRYLVVATAASLSLLLVVPAAGAEPVASRQWAKQLCGAVSGWLGAIDRAANVEPAPAGDSLAESAQLVTLLGDSQRATRRLVKRVKQAGDPDLPKGAKIARVYREVYGDLAVALGDARDSLRSVDRGSPDAAPVAFATAIADARSSFALALTDAQERIDGAKVLSSKPLVKALRAQPTCVAITG